VHRNLGDHAGQPAPRGRPRDQRAEDALLDAALALFVDGGLTATTFDGVARRAGVSRSTLYRRWKTRDDLLLAALTSLRSRAEAGLEDWADRPLADLLDLFEQLTVHAMSDPQSMNLLRQVVALPEDSPVRSAYWSSIVAPRRAIFAGIIRAARERGELPSGADPELLQDQLAGALAYRALVHPERATPHEAQRYVQSLLVSLGLRRNQTDPDG